MNHEVNMADTVEAPDLCDDCGVILDGSQVTLTDANCVAPLRLCGSNLYLSCAAKLVGVISCTECIDQADGETYQNDLRCAGCRASDRGY